MSQPHDPPGDGRPAGQPGGDPDGAAPQRPAGPYPPPPQGAHPGWAPPGWGPPGPAWGQQQPSPQQHPQPFPRHFPQPGYRPPPRPGYAPPPAGPHPWGPQPGQQQPPQQPWGQFPGQPQPWAQPGGPWGPPPAPRHRRRWPWLLGLLALVALGAVALPLALRGTALDPAAVQRDVAAQYQQLRGADLELRCSSEMPVQVDRTYRCTGTTDADAPVDITIRVTGRDGAYTWTDGS